MIELKPDVELEKENPFYLVPLALHHSFYSVYEKLKKWLARYSHASDNSIFTDFILVYLLGTRRYLEHRNPTHLFRLILSIHFMQEKLVHAITIHSNLRHLEIRWIPTSLSFPFCSKPVLGCLIGFNVMDRYEVFDEENILLALQKHLPTLRLVKESAYCHSQYKNLKIFYLEIEKQDNSVFSLSERTLLKNNLEEKIRKSIQLLSPKIFMGPGEEVYKNILALSQEIQNLHDLPQAYITLDQQTSKEIVFCVTLVYVLPFHPFSLKERFTDASFSFQRSLTVRYLDKHPIEAQLFCLHLPRTASLLRSDGSLNFYAARKKVVDLLATAIGAFRDYNGGILIKQQELLYQFKENFPKVSKDDEELLDSFFYALVPLEKQVVLSLKVLSTLFTYFQENCQEDLKDSLYAFKIYEHEQQIFFTIKGEDSSLAPTTLAVLQDSAFASLNIAYNVIHTNGEIFINGVLLQEEDDCAKSLMRTLQESLSKWHQNIKERQVLRVGIEYSLISLDPRVGGEVVSGNVLRLLFEGLTRLHLNGSIEHAVAESIEISSDSRQYIFKLRPCLLWNDGSRVTAYDFEYAWKKILSPDFKTSFDYLFHPIKNAKEAKEGKVSLEQVGVQALDDRTLKVELAYPSPYFLQLTALPLYSPVHRFIDQQHPEWPYQCGDAYPCNGPFQLKFNQPDQGYQLIKNPLYWDADHIPLNHITLTQMNPVQAFQAFQKKEIDWIGAPFGGWHSSYVPGKDDQLVSFLNNTWICWLVFNTMAFPFQHCKLRQAFAYAVQRAQIVSYAFLPLRPAYFPTSPYSRTNRRSLFPDFDKEKARQLFNEALKELNIAATDFSQISFTFLEKGIREHAAHCLREQFKECLGIELYLKPLPWSAFFSKITKGDFQIGLNQWTSLVDDPTYTLNIFKSAEREMNFAKWANEAFQNLIELSEREVSPFQRSSYLLEAERILSQEMPIVPLFSQAQQALISKDLHVLKQVPCNAFNIARNYHKKMEV